MWARLAQAAADKDAGVADLEGDVGLVVGRHVKAM